MTLYLVEDDEIYAAFVKKSLAKNLEYTISWFPTAEACLETIDKQGMPDALILDYNLPGMLGIALYEKIKSKLGDRKAIMMSSIDDGNLVLGFIQRGVRDYVIKDENVIESLTAILEGKEDLFTF